MRRRLGATVAAAALVAAGAVLGGAATASADAVGDCSASSGVLVAVDLRPFGGSITRGCDATPTTGLEALHSAGFGTEGTAKDGPAFVCRIDGMPTPAHESCNRTPPADAYWSYWHADRGRTAWTYSPKGAQSSSPGDGSVDAWVFGATDLDGTGGGPSFTPAQVRAGVYSGAAAPTRSSSAPRTSTAPRTRPPARRTTRPATPAVSSSGPTRDATTSARARTSPGSSDVSRSTPATSGSASAPLIVDATPAAADAERTSSGSMIPLVVVVALVALFGAGAVWTSRRRRHSDVDEY